MNSKKVQILIVDDDKELVEEFEDHFDSSEYSIDIAYDGPTALKKIRDTPPNLVILDILLTPEMDGHEVCRELKNLHVSKIIPVIILTNQAQKDDQMRGISSLADYYLMKPFDFDILDKYIEKALRKVRPYEIVEDCSVCLTLQNNEKINIEIKGDIVAIACSKKNLHIEEYKYTGLAEEAYKNKSHAIIKETGKNLYRELFSDHEEVISNYRMAVGRISNKSNKNLHLRLISDREFLQVPLEFFHDHIDFLALKHPLSRTIRGIEITKKTLSPAFLNQLWENNDALKIILIASNTSPSIPGADREIEILEPLLNDFFKKKGLETFIKAVPTWDATYETVKEELKKCKYHIVHYAGHGNFDKESTDYSSIYFWEKAGNRGKILPISVTQLKTFFRNSDTRFCYLNCCWGSATGNIANLYKSDFLGIVDGLVHAGVPSVLGFRWPVSDERVIEFSEEFYKSLAENGQIDTAVWDARNSLYGIKDDFTWISSILVMQD